MKFQKTSNRINGQQWVQLRKLLRGLKKCKTTEEWNRVWHKCPFCDYVQWDELADHESVV